MARRAAEGERRDKQLLLRLTPEQADWLEVAGFLERSTANEYVFKLVQAHVDALKSNEQIKKARNLRIDYFAARADTVELSPRLDPDQAETSEDSPNSTISKQLGPGV